MLIAKAFSNKIKAFILTLNATEQKDKAQAIDKFCGELESDVYTAIKSITITIAPGSIIVNGANGGGPVVATNVAPIILNKVVS